MILYAVNIHVGGGKIILDQLLSENNDTISHVFVDKRYTFPPSLPSELKFTRVAPTLFSRIKAEFRLRKLSKIHKGEHILIITNMPPIFRLYGRTTLFLQNALLLPGQLKYCHNVRHFIKTYCESLVLKLFNKNLDEVEVQTEWMKKSLETFFRKPIYVKPIKPALPDLVGLEKKYDYVTVTSSIAYKNLDFLLNSWLSTPQLIEKSLIIVTDSLTNNQQQLLNKLLEKKFNIYIKTNVSRHEIFKLYEECETLIITSSIESYGLPLYEASHFKANIIAPDLPYVQDSRIPFREYKLLDEKSFIKAILKPF